MNLVLWILAGLLAALFLAAGAMKASQSKEKLGANPNMAWTGDFSAGTIKFIGLVEVLGALGLILPAAFGIATVLTPLAATGLAVVMALAIVVHARRGETKALPMNVVLLVLAAVVAWGRFGPYSF